MSDLGGAEETILSKVKTLVGGISTGQLIKEKTTEYVGISNVSHPSGWCYATAGWAKELVPVDEHHTGRKFIILDLGISLSLWRDLWLSVCFSPPKS